MRLRSTILGLVLCASLSSSALANTYIVDAGGGGQFTDIQSAITASQPGDVLLVHAGSYNGFALDRGLVIVGYGGVSVFGSAQIVNVPTGERAALVGITADQLIIQGCSGPVVVQHLTTHDPNGAHADARVTQSNDVRMADVFIDPNTVSGMDVFEVDGSRLELVDTTVRGNYGQPSPTGNGGNGGRGIVAGPSTRIQAVRCHINGGSGGETLSATSFAGNGAAGLSLSFPSQVFLTGPGGIVAGGDCGLDNYYCCECDHDGTGACGVTGSGVVQHSGTQVIGGYTDQSQHCSGGQNGPGFCGPTDTIASPADPSVRILGTPSASATITFMVYGEPGASVVLNLGRNMILDPTPGVDIERLTPAGRVIPLGTIPATGSLTHSFTLPASFTPGLLFVAQAEVTGSTGLKRTNSTPIVVR